MKSESLLKYTARFVNPTVDDAIMDITVPVASLICSTMHEKDEIPESAFSDCQKFFSSVAKINDQSPKTNCEYKRRILRLAPFSWRNDARFDLAYLAYLTQNALRYSALRDELIRILKTLNEISTSKNKVTIELWEKVIHNANTLNPNGTLEYEVFKFPVLYPMNADSQPILAFRDYHTHKPPRRLSVYAFFSMRRHFLNKLLQLSGKNALFKEPHLNSSSSTHLSRLIYQHESYVKNYQESSTRNTEPVTV